jgi:hypothetical protein
VNDTPASGDCQSYSAPRGDYSFDTVDVTASCPFGDRFGNYYAHVQTVPNPTIGTLKDMDSDFVGTDYSGCSNTVSVSVK